MVRHLVLTSVLVSVFSTIVAGTGFLHPNGGVTTAAVDGVFQSETSSRIKQVEELKVTLQPMYKSLPKNEHGKLDPSTVRYALHRYFVHTYGWYVKGLDINEDAWNTTSSTYIMEDQVPDHIMGLLEKRVRGRGIDLSDLATFAATLTELIEKDVTSSFEQCFAMTGFNSTDVVEDGDVDFALQGYLAHHLYGGDEPILSPKYLEDLKSSLDRNFPGWPDAKMWLKDSRQTLDWAQQFRRNPFIPHQWTWSKLETAVHDIMFRFTEVASAECASMKSLLLENEYKGTGRVLLGDYYSANEKRGHPMETADYLRDLGCLDESDPQRPMLLIANTVSSRANCLVDTTYYSTCCVNECEGLLLHLERKLASPTADPTRIAEIMSLTPSQTVDAPRNLSLSLTRRLVEIADVHGGRVPIHGRLFSQWMHHAYPRECPYPHHSGTYRQMTQEEWIGLKGLKNVLISEKEMHDHISNPALIDMEEKSNLTRDSLPWSSQEEIIATHRWREPSLLDFTSVLRTVMGCVALSSMAFPLARALLVRKTSLDVKTTHCV